MMKHYLSILFICTAGLASAVAHLDEANHGVIINFDEPVVRQSELGSSEQEPFTLTGDADHRPTYRWVDQDRLLISFAKGTSVFTEFRLAFKPGQDQYLSGKKMKQSVYTFTCPRSELVSTQVPGTTTSTFCVYPHSEETAEARTFSPTSPVSYEFRAVDKTNSTVPAIVTPAKLGLLPDHLVQRALLRLRDEGADWKSICRDTEIPGMVMVQAAQPLNADEQWILRKTPSPESGFTPDNEDSYRRRAFRPEKELGTAVRQIMEQKKKEENDQSPSARHMRLLIQFSAPIAIQNLPELFRTLTIRAKGQDAVNTEDGSAKTLCIDGKTTRFTLIPPKAVPVSRISLANYEEVEVDFDEEEEEVEEEDIVPEGSYSISYAPGETTGILIDIDDLSPTELDIIIPEGVKSLGGQTTCCTHTHRISVNPAIPTLGKGTAFLPIKGTHNFRLPSMNVESLELQAYHIGINEIQKLTTADLRIFQQDGADAEYRDYLLHELAVEEKALELQTLPNVVTINRIKRLKKSLTREEQEYRKHHTRILGILQQLRAFAPQRQNTTPTAANSLISPAATEINLDTLTGGDTRPGIYIVCVKPTISADTRRMLDTLRASTELFESPRYYLIGVTDIMATSFDRKVIVTRLSDGTLIREFSVITEKGDTIAVQHGLGEIPENNRSYSIVKVGDDFTHLLTRSSEENDDDYRLEILRDRPLYRPGDTVNLRGFSRKVTPTGECSIDPEQKLLQLVIRRPNGEIMQRSDLTPDACGAWQFSFTLPEGEEDITGHYSVEVKSGKRYTEQIEVPCQVFRRNAYGAELTVTCDDIAPKTFSVNITATDLNGSPLSHADVELKLKANHRMISLKKGDKATDEITHHMQTDAQGKAQLTGYIAEDLSQFRSGYLELQAKASIANDRNEYLKVDDSCFFSAADFDIELDDRTQAISLTPADEESDDEYLPREQKLHVTITGIIQEEEPYANGFSLLKYRPKTLFEQDITIPAHCEDGVKLPLTELCKTPGLISKVFRITITGTDPAGRTTSYESTWHEDTVFCMDDEVVSREQAEQRTRIALSGDIKEGKLQLEMRSPRAGEALLLIHSRKGTRLVPQQVNGDRETLTLPLLEGENGEIKCELMQLTADGQGFFSHWVQAQCSQDVPRTDMELRVELQLPEQETRPGSELTLTGRVTLPDGAPADAAVTLFAVDEGMISVSGYELPQFIQVFSHASAVPFNWIHKARQSYHPVSLQPARCRLLTPQLWDGRIIGKGRYFPRPYGGMQDDASPAPMALTAMGGGLGAATMRSNRTARAEEEEEEGEDEGVLVHEPAEEDEDDDSEDSWGESRRKSQGAPAPVLYCTTGTESDGAGSPRLRTDFAPVAVWQAALMTDAQGNFSTTVKLPDTLTTYHVFAVAASRCGKRFGQAEGEFRVNQPVMLTPGTPLFMSLGDCLRLPLTITNNTEQAATWNVTLEGADAPQNITLQPGTTGTLYFDYTAASEGTTRLHWKATAAAGGDAVEGSFEVRFPAPVLKETHHLIQQTGTEPLVIAKLPAPELAGSSRSSIQLELSASPLLHLASSMDYVLNYPYGCTEQTASGLMPWIFHKRLAPFSPKLESVSEEKVAKVISDAVDKLFQRQREDGGLSYWGDGEKVCLWASAHAAMVFTVAEENGICLPEDKMKKLRRYLSTRSSEELQNESAYTRYSIGRACGHEQMITDALAELQQDTTPAHWRWCHSAAVRADIRFISELRRNPAARHDAFLRWMRTRGHDYRHMTTWQSGWMFVALGEYLRLEPAQHAAATVRLQDGQQLTLSNGITRYTPPAAARLSEQPTTITTTQGTAYLNVKFRALPEQTEYPGVTEKGLQVTRVYEKKDANGKWKPATEFCVGDVVRITLTCAKAAPELQYFVLEDYLPACMEAINPHVPSQSAGLELEWRPWSRWFDHKEYLADRVRGFCTRWSGRNLLNMSYYARVKRAGTATAPPAEAQLMYEPQIYGLSPNTRIISK